MLVVKGLLLIVLTLNLTIFVFLLVLDKPLVFKASTGECIKVISKSDSSCSSLPKKYNIKII